MVCDSTYPFFELWGVPRAHHIPDVVRSRALNGWNTQVWFSDRGCSLTKHPLGCGHRRLAQEQSCVSWSQTPPRTGLSSVLWTVMEISKRVLLAHVAIPTWCPEEAGRCPRSKGGLMYWIFFNCKSRHPVSCESGSLRPFSLLRNSCPNESSLLLNEKCER